MSGPTAGARLGYTGKEAKEKGQELLDNFFKGFSGVKIAIDDSKKFLRRYGYVEDFIGRQRRLPEINMNPYDAQLKYKTQESTNPNFNPLFGCGYRKISNDPVAIWQQILDAYVILSNLNQLRKNCTYQVKKEMSNMAFENYKKIAANPSVMLSKQIDTGGKYIDKRTNEQKIIEDLAILSEFLQTRYYKKSYIEPNEDLDRLVAAYRNKYDLNYPKSIPNTQMSLQAWTGKIAQAERQCFNARIQGSAASLTKLAMIDIYNDPILNQCKTKLIIPVHDELLVECPEEYADIVEKRLPEVMINAAKRGGDDVPQSCDPYNVSRWYSDTAGAFIQEEFKKLEAKGKTREAALAEVIKNHIEVPEAAIIKTIETGCDLEF